jgi:hemerythrin-like domain-containing protein
MTAPIKATDALLTDHKMIRKVLSEMRREDPRFLKVVETGQRIIKAHAWFEDTLFLPAIEKSPLLARQFTDEIYREHKDIEVLLGLLRQTPASEGSTLNGFLMQFKALMESHLSKEEAALFPMAERILDSEGMNKLGAEMRARAHEVRPSPTGNFLP